MSAQAKAAVSGILSAAGFHDIACTYMGTTSRDNWNCDEWRFTLTRKESGNIERFEFPFFTGVGLRQPSNVPTKYPAPLKAKHQWEKPVAPHPADLVYSLLLDGAAANVSFNDWCADYGYDSDSIKALSTYQECCKTGETMRRMFTVEQRQALADALQDY